MASDFFPEGFPFDKPWPQGRRSDATNVAVEAPAAPASEPAASVGSAVVPSRERRRAPRQTLVAKALLRCDSATADVAAGFVSNISMLGVGFHTRKALSIGAKYQIRVEVGPMKWSTRLRVVSCQAHGASGTYDIGAEFVGNELAAARAGRSVAA